MKNEKLRKLKQAEGKLSEEIEKKLRNQNLYHVLKRLVEPLVDRQMKKTEETTKPGTTANKKCGKTILEEIEN